MSANLAIPTQACCSHGILRCPECVAPAVGYPELERASDSRLQQAIASAYAAMIQRTIAKGGMK